MFKSFAHNDLWRNDYSAVMANLVLIKDLRQIDPFRGYPPCVRASVARGERTILVRRGCLGVLFAR
jgi:hypothetical protein